MKNLKVTDCKKALTQHDIINLEKILHITLPEEYKNFLLLNNGGQPDKDCYPMLSKNIEGADIAWFYAYYEGKISSLTNEYEENKDIIPEDFISIGYGSGGNEICLGVSGPAFGKLYFFVRNWASDEEGAPLPDNMYLISNNFTDYINSLYHMDVDGKTGDDGEFKTEKYVYTHDKYSLPYSTHAKKYGTTVTEFFFKAPTEVEDYVIEEQEASKDVVLYYDNKSENKRYQRIIKEDGTIENSIVPIAE